MRKKIVCILLGLILAFGMSGCALFEHNYEKDYRQVIAVVNPISETRNVVENDENKEVTYSTEKEVIYKSELISLCNSSLSSLVNSNGMTVQQAVETLYERLVLQKLVLAEADLRIKFGDIKWEVHEDNTVTRSIYASIDSQLETLRNEIRAERGEQQVTNTTEDNDSSTTYPTPSEEEEDEIRDTEAWSPVESHYPGLYGNADRISLDNQAMARLIQTLKENVESDFRVTDAQKAKFDAEFAEWERIADTKGMAYVYPKLYVNPALRSSSDGETADEDTVLGWVLGTTVKDNLKISLLQEYLTDSAVASEQDIIDKFESLKVEQKTSYDADYSAYKTAITSTSNTTPIVYYPDSNYFFVKHILVPFSDEQTAMLTAYKNDKTHTKAEIEAYRDNLVKSIVAYRHVDGENDTTHAYTADEVFKDVVNKMKPYAGGDAAAQAEKKFDELIYLYNTDPGIFNNAKGYALAYKLADGDTDTYMKEFCEGARELYADYQVGDVLLRPVITDYGMHIMYFAGKTEKGFVTLKTPETPGSKNTYYDLVKEVQEMALQNSRFTEWQQTRIAYYDKLSTDDIPEANRVIVRYTKRFADLYE